MKNVWPKCEGRVIRGRMFTQQDLVLIRRTIRSNPSWGRTKLSEELCKVFNWYQPNGRPKDRACRVALLKLESLGYLQLPRQLLERGGRPPSTTLIPLEDAVVSTMPKHIVVQLVQSQGESRRWNSLIAKHHYLGLATPVGRLLRYLIHGDGSLLAAISFSEAAWNIRPRNELFSQLGFSEAEIRNDVVGNNRFLILPTVSVKNLASRILASSVKQMAIDWKMRYGKSPIAVETFVDPERFHGTCYRAANWIEIGRSQGFSKRGASHSAKHSPKIIMVRGITTDIHNSIDLLDKERTLRAA